MSLAWIYYACVFGKPYPFGYSPSSALVDPAVGSPKSFIASLTLAVASCLLLDYFYGWIGKRRGEYKRLIISVGRSVTYCVGTETHLLSDKEAPVTNTLINTCTEGEDAKKLNSQHYSQRNRPPLDCTWSISKEVAYQK